MRFLLMILVFSSVSTSARDQSYGFSKYTFLRFIRELLKIYIPHKQHGFTNRRPATSVVYTSTGPVVGYLAESTRDGVPYAAFVGIPFAEPPIGSLRFKAPVQKKPWEDVLDATKEAPPCIGVNQKTMNEDCLYLNIYTPRFTKYKDSRKKVGKAVMVYIYGGAFQTGDSTLYNLSPDFFVDKDVLFVTLNYRLGAFGFLSLQNEEVPGNAGLKDQLLALKWINENIASFGGDPDRIVVFGESAGAASTSYHQLSARSQGLFSGVIMESGNALCQWAYIEPTLAVQHAYGLGEDVGCSYDISNSETKAELIECLRGVSIKKLLRYSLIQVSLSEIDNLRFFGFLPTTEPDIEGAMITKHPREILVSGQFNKVNTMLGQNSREGLIVTAVLDKIDPLGVIIHLLLFDLSHFIPYEVWKSVNKAQAKRISKSIKQFYFKDASIAKTLRLADLVSDVQFSISIQEWALLVAQKSNAPVFNYYFSYDGPYNLAKQRYHISAVPGASHVDELGYLMNNYDLHDVYNHDNRNVTAELTIDRMVGMWTNFAKTGDPRQGGGTPEYVDWKPYTTYDYYYLEIGSNLVLDIALLSNAMRFWNDIYEAYVGRRPFPEMDDLDLRPDYFQYNKK